MAAVLSCPVIGLAAMTAFGIYSAENIVFGTESNKLASGGFGPNQVSATFSFAAILLMLFVSSEKIQLPLRILLIGGTGLLLVQSVMTFSRSGLYAAFCAYIPAFLYLLRDRKYRVQIVATLGVLAMAGLIVYPYLDDFTGGALYKRYSSTQMTGREELMATDMETWLKNPVWGVGVGLSAFYHARRAASHNEITRWLVEHGAVGVMMLGAVLATALHSLLVRKGVARAIAASAMTWALLFLFSNGFRIAAPALAFALGCLRINSEESNALS
jgi:hypothetical protein